MAKVGEQQGVRGVAAAGQPDPKAQTLGRLKALFEQLPAKGYYFKIDGENAPLTKANVALALEKLDKGNSVSVVKDLGKGEGWGTSSYRRHTGNPRVAEQYGNMFKAASNDQLVAFETKLRAHLANPNDVPKGWGR